MSMWRSQSVQFSIFANNADQEKADSLFEYVFADDPTSIQRNKNPTPENPFFSLASAQLGDLVCSVQIQPGRIDFVIQPSDNQDPEQIATIDTKAAYASVTEKLEKWPIKSLDVSRVSTFANLYRPALSRDEANDELIKLSGMTVSFNDGTDFLVQLNRQKAFAFNSSFTMNRLFRYHEVAQQRLRFQFAVNGVAAPQAIWHYGAGLLLDFNTVPTGALIDPVHVGPIYKELIAEILSAAETMAIEKFLGAM